MDLNLIITQMKAIVNPRDTIDYFGVNINDSQITEYKIYYKNRNWSNKHKYPPVIQSLYDSEQIIPFSVDHTKDEHGNNHFKYDFRIADKTEEGVMKVFETIEFNDMTNKALLDVCNQFKEFPVYQEDQIHPMYMCSMKYTNDVLKYFKSYFKTRVYYKDENYEGDIFLNDFFLDFIKKSEINSLYRINNSNIINEIENLIRQGSANLYLVGIDIGVSEPKWKYKIYLIKKDDKFKSRLLDSIIKFKSGFDIGLISKIVELEDDIYNLEGVAISNTQNNQLGINFYFKPPQE